VLKGALKFLRDGLLIDAFEHGLGSGGCGGDGEREEQVGRGGIHFRTIVLLFFCAPD
jgi:hypothetical protein